MARPMIVLMVLACILLPRVSCGAGQGASPLQLRAQDSGRTIEIQAGGPMDLALHENATTGFQWEIAAINEKILKQTRQPEFKPDSGARGAGGIKTFYFVTVAPGETDLKLLYRRPWEVKVPPAATFRVTIRVRE